MPDKKLNELQTANLPLEGDEFLLVDQGGLSRKIKIDDLPSGGGGDVDSVNGFTGVVVLDAEDVGALPDDTTYVTTINGQSGVVELTSADVDAVPVGTDAQQLGGFNATIRPSDERSLNIFVNETHEEVMSYEYDEVFRQFTTINSLENVTNRLMVNNSSRIEINSDFIYGDSSLNSGGICNSIRSVKQGSGTVGSLTGIDCAIEILEGSVENSSSINSYVFVGENVSVESINGISSEMNVQDGGSVDFSTIASYNCRIEETGSVNNFNGIRSHLTAQDATSSLTGGTEMCQLGAFGLGTVENFTGLGVTYNVEGETQNFSGISVGVSSSSDITNSAKGLVINMGTHDTTVLRRQAIDVNNGIITQFNQISTQDNLFVDQGNGFFTGFAVLDGSPITGTEFIANNFGSFVRIEDDYTVGPIGFGITSLAMVGNISVANGKNAERISLCIAGGSTDGSQIDGGNVDELNLYTGVGLLNFDMSTMTVDKQRAFYAPDYSAMIVATNRWGIHIEDPGAENYINKSLVIGGATETVSNDDVALEVADKKALKLAPMTIAERDALTPAPFMIVAIDDGPTQEIQFYNGSSWGAI